jgi:hypothetical protein
VTLVSAKPILIKINKEQIRVDSLALVWYAYHLFLRIGSFQSKGAVYQRSIPLWIEAERKHFAVICAEVGTSLAIRAVGPNAAFTTILWQPYGDIHIWRYGTFRFGSKLRSQKRHHPKKGDIH